MTTNEIIDKLRDMSVAKMGPAEGVIVSRAVWEYNILSPDNAQKEELGKLIVSKAEQMKEAEATVDGFEYPSAQNLLYTAFTITGDEEYKNIITALEKSDKNMGLAFDMNYETYFGGKEHYHAITVRFAALKAQDRDEMQEALFMLSLVDTIAAIAQPVYELYRSLVDIFRDELKKLVNAAWQRANRMPAGVGAEHVPLFCNQEANEVMSVALLKACVLKVVLAEKYEAYIA